MSDSPAAQRKLEDSLRHIVNLLEKHRLVERMVDRDQVSPRHELIESLVHRQHLVELQLKLRGLHPADIAYILEALPLDDRLLIWRQIQDDCGGEVLLEVSDAVRDSLIETLEPPALIKVLAQLDADDLAALAEAVPDAVLAEVSQKLNARDRDWLQTTMAYPETVVGHLMSQDVLTVRGDHRVEQVLRMLRGRADLPHNTDSLYVVDIRNLFKGVLPLRALLLNDPEARVADLTLTDQVVFDPNDNASDAARAFQRYDLVSAPVVNERGKLIGRLTVDAVVDFIREESEEDALNMAGLRGDEDLFAPIWDSARNRWLWLSVNLCTAFIASRAIGLFEDAITRIVALATLMPIVAGIGGNSGNQTTTLVVRGLALGEITPDNTWHLVFKELGVGLLNGVVWGATVGVFAYVLYWNVSLGLVMAAAMLLNLLLAAAVGVAIPLVQHHLGRDPAFGSSVLLTFITDGMGFFHFSGVGDGVFAVAPPPLTERRETMLHQAIAKRGAVSILAATLTLSAGLAGAEDQSPQPPPTADATAADLLIARPGGLVATVLGSAVFVVGLPFTLLSGSTGQAAQTLVVEPAQYTFARPLGQDM